MTTCVVLLCACCGYVCCAKGICRPTGEEELVSGLNIRKHVPGTFDTDDSPDNYNNFARGCDKYLFGIESVHDEIDLDD